jgi:tRNA(Ile2) C34 agmatinyltransferase TiaS
MAIAQNICFKYQKQGIVDVLLELNKALTGQRMDERIQLFNVETVDDLKMLETMTKNPGIRTGNVKKI